MSRAPLTRASIDKINRLFSLPYQGWEQDWEIELADASRIGAFVAAYDRADMTANDRFALMALLLASVDDYLNDHHAAPLEWPRIADILVGDVSIHRSLLEYWNVDGDEDPEHCFSLTPLIREILRRM